MFTNVITQVMLEHMKKRSTIIEIIKQAKIHLLGDTQAIIMAMKDPS